MERAHRRHGLIKYNTEVLQGIEDTDKSLYWNAFKNVSNKNP